MAVVGIALIAARGELVAYGAEGIIRTAGLSAGIVGMVITPAAIEAEEIIRQVVPAQRGYADVSAGNVIGTVLYFLLVNLGLIALITPVNVPMRVLRLDWPFLVGSAVVVAVLLMRGRVNRLEGTALLGLGVAYGRSTLPSPKSTPRGWSADASAIASMVRFALWPETGERGFEPRIDPSTYH